MEVLSVGGKDYVKASAIARDLGYTADYVGQLCRSHKVTAKLVGRSWYVERGSILDHKANRYRSTQTKSREQLKEVVRLKTDQNHENEPLTPKFYAHSRTARVSYLEDDAELIPVVGKIREKSDLRPVERKEEESTRVEIHFPKTASRPHTEEVKNKTKNIDISSSLTSAADVKSKSIHPRTQKTRSTAQNRKKAEKLPLQTLTTLGLSLAASVAVASVLIFLEVHVEAAEQTVTTSYVLGTDTPIAFATDFWARLKNTFHLVEFSTNIFIF